MASISTIVVAIIFVAVLSPQIYGDGDQCPADPKNLATLKDPLVESQYDPNEGWPSNTSEPLLDFNYYRYHPEKERYFRLGTTNPCNKNMAFFAIPEDARLGRCDCNWLEGSRPLLFDTASEQCYSAWSQGPCKEGEWYTFGNEMLPTCQLDPCPEFTKPDDTTGNFYFLNPDDNKCYHTEYDSAKLCLENMHLAIFPYEPIPKCRDHLLTYPLMVPIIQLCIQANRLHVENICHFAK